MKDFFIFLIEVGAFWTHSSNFEEGKVLKFNPTSPPEFVKQALEAWFFSMGWGVRDCLEVEYGGFCPSAKKRHNPRIGGADQFWVPLWHFRKSFERLSSCEDESYSYKEVTVWTVTSLLNGKVQVWKQTWTEETDEPGDEPECSKSEYSEYVIEDTKNIFI